MARRLWNVAAGGQIATLPTGSDRVNSVAFSRDGKTLATGGERRDSAVERRLSRSCWARLCSQVGNSLTRPEWTWYVPPGPAYRDVCARDP